MGKCTPAICLYNTRNFLDKSWVLGKDFKFTGPRTFKPKKSKKTMKIACLSLLIASAAALRAPMHEDIAVFGNDMEEESFIDSIYGELIESEESAKYKQGLLDSQQVVLHAAFLKDDLSETSVAEMESLLLSKNYASFAEVHQKHVKEEQAKKSHESYKKYKSEVKYPNDDDTTDINGLTLFGGIVTFAHYDHFNCFDPKLNHRGIDIAIVGAPFDTGVSYRPGARFGPEGIRLNSRRLGQGRTPVRGNGKPGSKLIGLDPYATNFSVIDCGDVPMTPFDNRIALNQLYRGERAIHKHKTSISGSKAPKIITMGGDHTITLMALKSAYEQFGQLSVLHFDSHIDTWNPKVLGGGITSYMSLNHGTFLHYAAENGYLNKSSCMHVGLRAPYIAPDYDISHDEKCGFETITARDLDNYGKDGVIERILERVGKDQPVYISVDIDVLDPSTAPATGTMEAGGWTTRELLSILDGLEGINLIGADVVEVSPPFDTSSEITQLAATAVIDSFLGLMMVNDL